MDSATEESVRTDEKLLKRQTFDDSSTDYPHCFDDESTQQRTVNSAGTGSMASRTAYFSNLNDPLQLLEYQLLTQPITQNFPLTEVSNFFQPNEAAPAPQLPSIESFLNKQKTTGESSVTSPSKTVNPPNVVQSPQGTIPVGPINPLSFLYPSMPIPDDIIAAFANCNDDNATQISELSQLLMFHQAQAPLTMPPVVQIPAFDEMDSDDDGDVDVSEIAQFYIDDNEDTADLVTNHAVQYPFTMNIPPFNLSSYNANTNQYAPRVKIPNDTTSQGGDNEDNANGEGGEDDDKPKKRRVDRRRNESFITRIKRLQQDAIRHRMRYQTMSEGEKEMRRMKDAERHRRRYYERKMLRQQEHQRLQRLASNGEYSPNSSQTPETPQSAQVSQQ